MKYILILCCLFFVSVIFTSPGNKHKKSRKPKTDFGLKKMIHKKLSQRITAQGALLSFVDESTASVGTQFPIVLRSQSVIDWKRLAAFVTEPGRIAQTMDPEIEFNLQ